MSGPLSVPQLRKDHAGDHYRSEIIRCLQHLVLAQLEVCRQMLHPPDVPVVLPQELPLLHPVHQVLEEGRWAC